jgi:cytochrome P450
MTELALHDPRLYDRGFPYERFKELRDTAPVSHHEHEDFAGGYWVVARHADVQAVSRNSHIWRNAPGPMVETPPGQALEPQMDMLINLDGAAHTNMRKIVNRGFTPKRVSMLESSIRSRVTSIIDALKDRSAADLVADLAMWLPLHVIADLVGVPEPDRRYVFELTERTFGFDADLVMAERMAAATDMFAYAEELSRTRQAAPQDDLLSLLLTAELDGHRLTQMQVSMFFMLLQNAGSETTRNLITTGTLALLQRPDQYKLLRDDPEFLPTAIEELLRWSTPVMYFCRQAALDTKLAGVPIKAGERVLLSYTSANYDERAFDDPRTLDITRQQNEHVAFGGGGAHFCLGASLARLEARVMFEAILTRFEGLAVDADLAMLPRVNSNFIDGFAEVPVTWSAIS